MARRKKDSFMAVRRHGGSTCPPMLRKAMLCGLAGIGGLILLGFIGYAQLLSYLQGEDFRDLMERTLANKARATTVEITGTLGIDANRVSVQGIKVRRADSLQEVEGRSIHAELNRSALLDNELHLTRLMVEEGELSLDADRAAEKLPEVRKAAAGFLSRLAPTHTKLERLDCNDFNATLRLGGKDYTLADSSLSATPAPRQGKGAWELRLNNGRVHTPLPILGDSNLKNATLTLGEKVATLSDARFILSPGELIVNAVRERRNGEWSADIRANSVDISRLIGEDWKKRLTGNLYGRLRADGNGEGLRQAEGKLSLQQGELVALPFLENLPIGNSHPYRSLRLEKATARLSYPHADTSRNIQKAWLLDEIDLRAEGGWLRVRGHALVDGDGSLGGTLLIGLPDNIATKLAPVDAPLHQRLFNAGGDEGYLWLRLNLSGSLSAPQEDLSVRLMTLLGGDALPQAADTLRQILLPQKDEQNPAEEDDTPPATDTPGRLMNEAGKAAGEVIGSGLRSLF